MRRVFSICQKKIGERNKMKKILFAVVIAVSLMTGRVYAESPTDKGVYSISGGFSYFNTKNGNGGNTNTALSFNPSGFYFVYPNLAIGASTLYYDSKNNGFKFKEYGIGPVVRYYVGKEPALLFVSTEYLYTKTKGGIFSSTSRGTGNEVSLGMGADYFLAKNVALEPLIRYTFRHVSGDSHSNEFLIGMGINVFIF
jgi:hypothetical protein